MEALQREMLRASLSLTACLFRKHSLILTITLQKIKDTVSILQKRKLRGTAMLRDGWSPQLLACGAGGAQEEMDP